MIDVSYQLIVSDLGSATLMQGGEVMWTSDGDDDFRESVEDAEVIDIDDEAQIEDVLGFLVDEGYIPPNTDVEVLPEENQWMVDES
jgi:hypothetical protein